MALEQLQPEKVFRYFEEITKIPHGSGNTKKISDYCAAFARERGLRYAQDKLNNIVIYTDATPGCEKAEPVILQGHLDMVCASEGSFDFTSEALRVGTDGEWVFAEGTTLGGDDGIAVAMMLAILDSPELRHPALECMFTVDEETGMYGAAGIDPSLFHARRMINLDGEDEGVFTVGCAGGVRANCTLPIHRSNRVAAPMEIKISGLNGGHSGAEIDKGRANAIMLMGRMLDSLCRVGDIGILSLSGGSADNAIPDSCSAVLTLPVSELGAITVAASECHVALRKEYSIADPGLTMDFKIGEPEEFFSVTPDNTRRIADLLMMVPYGVQEFSRIIPGMVQTSLNPGIIRLSKEQLAISFSVRSNVASQKEYLKRRLDRILHSVGGFIDFVGEYPAWEYVETSAVRDAAAKVWEQQNGKAPEMLVIHAGLECGLLSEKLPGLDCVSLGPDMKDIHTPGEKLSVRSVARIWNFLTAVLEELSA